MPDLELRRSPTERRLYTLEGVGTLRLEGFFSRAATAEADGKRWRFARRDFWMRRLEAADVTGATVGSFEPRTVRRGGVLYWGQRELALRPASAWRERYALFDADDELALFDGKGWGRRPVTVSIDDPSELDPGLLLFAAFVVRGLAEDASSTAGGAGTAAVG
jgi:hypothetical protein